MENIGVITFIACALAILVLLVLAVRQSSQKAKEQAEFKAHQEFVRRSVAPLPSNQTSGEPSVFVPAVPFQGAPQAESAVECPRCRSTQLSADRKGYGWVKGLGLGVLTGGVGLLAGFHGSRKVLVTCLKCGQQWRPGA